MKRKGVDKESGNMYNNRNLDNGCEVEAIFDCRDIVALSTKVNVYLWIYNQGHTTFVSCSFMYIYIYI
jgi:hypothetical protein